MSKSKRSLLCVLALLLALCLPAYAEATGEDPIVVRVGQFSYPLSVVQGSLDSALDLASLLSGEEVTDEDRQSGVQAAIDKFVNLGVIECKLTEKGKNDFSEDEEELMKSAAQAKYEELWQSLYQRASKSGEEVSEEDTHVNYIIAILVRKHFTAVKYAMISPLVEDVRSLRERRVFQTTGGRPGM